MVERERRSTSNLKQRFLAAANVIRSPLMAAGTSKNEQGGGSKEVSSI